jgi:NAD(P)-dependent dehydrogenase (short-subunit alcohol dehydrogenase family)
MRLTKGQPRFFGNLVAQLSKVTEMTTVYGISTSRRTPLFSTSTHTKVVAITGASSGMGYEAAKLFARRGWTVFAGARRVEKIPADANIVALKLDVTVSESNKTFVKEILRQAGHIDILVNNAGYGEWGPAAEIPMEAAHKEFDTNFFGAAELTRLVLKGMLKRHRGRIINNGSIGGDVYMPLGAYYHSSKAALHMWSDILDLEIKKFGVRSIVVQPGWTRSSWGDVAIKNALNNLAPNSPYTQFVKTIQSVIGVFNSAPATSKDLAEVIYKAAMAPNPKLRYYNSLADHALVRIGRSHQKAWQIAMTCMFDLVMKVSEDADLSESLSQLVQFVKAKSLHSHLPLSR